jgi:hypothetical protein
MPRKYLQFIVFLFLLILATPFESGLRIQNSGWNTIIPSTSFLEIIVWTFIAIITFVYWLRIRKSKEIDFKIFIIHFLLTFPLVLYARFNLFIRQIAAKNVEDILELITVINIVAYSVLSIFFIGQIIFIAMLMKKSRQKNNGYK